METINIKGFELKLNSDIQLSKNGKQIRLSSIEKNLKLPEKWIDKVLKNHWIYSFRYIGTDNFVRFEFDYYDNFVGIVI